MLGVERVNQRCSNSQETENTCLWWCQLLGLSQQKAVAVLRHCIYACFKPERLLYHGLEAQSVSRELTSQQGKVDPLSFGEKKKRRVYSPANVNRQWLSNWRIQWAKQCVLKPNLAWGSSATRQGRRKPSGEKEMGTAPDWKSKRKCRRTMRS